MRKRLFACLLTFLVLLPSSVAAAPAADTSDVAWAEYRAAIPDNQPLYRPTWLPDRFTQPGAYLDDGVFFGVMYTSDAGDRLLFGDTRNIGSCLDDDRTVEPILVHGAPGTLTVPRDLNRSGCTLNVRWEVAGEVRFIIAFRSTVTREEMLLVVAGLALVGPDGAALPQPTSGATPGAYCFAETGQCAAGPFLDYWLANGGLARNGYPLTGEMVERLENGQLYQVQYFERVRMEYHQINQGMEALVLLGQFGRRIHGGIDPPVPPAPSATYFPETSHNLSGGFLTYWEANGGVMQFGFPITEEFTATLEDGKPYRVQYFERARFEYHPENAAPYDVLLGQFGRRILEEARQPGAPPGVPAITPTRPDAPPGTPTYTEADVRAFLDRYGPPLGKVGVAGPYTVEQVVFLTGAEAEQQWHVSLGPPPDRLYCLAVLRGTFTVAPPPSPDRQPTVITLHTVVLSFDARTGNLLVVSAGP